MTFTSPLFAPFLVVVLALAAACGRRLRWVTLLVASYAFYATWGVPYVVAALGVVTLGTWASGLALEREGDGRRGAALLGLAVTLDLGVLVALRYLPFLAENVNALVGLGGRGFRVSVPGPLVSVGVSYYTLQAISYLLDIRWGVVGAERHLGRFALYLAFFPKLVQGPIERGRSLLPQLADPQRIKVDDLVAGTQLLLWGLFQKVVVADRLAPFVESVYGDVHRHSGVPILVATYFFAAQLYFDFAGYTDMALGTARLFGIRLTQNFDSPYLARSVADFWRRWHISLSSWLLDYVFRPLQLTLRDWRTWGTPLALVVTFVVSGLWHGASWSFVVWGLLHGVYLGTSILYRRWQPKLQRALRLKGSRLLPPIQVAVTFHLVCFAWVFFRARSLGEGAWAAAHLVGGLPATLAALAHGELDELLYLGRGRAAFTFAVVLVALATLLRSYLQRAGVTQDVRERRRRPFLASSWARTAVYAWMVYLIAFLGTAAQGFIYARF